MKSVRMSSKGRKEPKIELLPLKMLRFTMENGILTAIRGAELAYAKMLSIE